LWEIFPKLLKQIFYLGEKKKKQPRKEKSYSRDENTELASKNKMKTFGKRLAYNSIRKD